MCHHITPQAGENGAKMRAKTAGKEEKQGTEREKTGTGRTDTGMAVHAAARKKRKNCNYAELGASCFCPPPLDVSFCDRKRISV